MYKRQNYYFDTEVLSTAFTASEITMLQYFGVIIMEAHLDNMNSDIILKCGLFREIGCHFLAGLAVAATAAVVLVATGGNPALALQALDVVCDILEALGIEFGFDLSGITETAIGGILGGLDLLDIDTGSISAGQIVCAVAIITGIYSAVFDWCCGDDDEGCNPIIDLCCNVNCGPGTNCVDGVCVPDPFHCYNTGNYPECCICTARGCVIDPLEDRCETNLDCDFPNEMRCIGGLCVPI